MCLNLCVTLHRKCVDLHMRSWVGVGMGGSLRPFYLSSFSKNRLRKSLPSDVSIPWTYFGLSL